jgi:predicted DNA-binding transcriptional regulator AlpA
MCWYLSPTEKYIFARRCFLLDSPLKSAAFPAPEIITATGMPSKATDRTRAHRLSAPFFETFACTLWYTSIITLITLRQKGVGDMHDLPETGFLRLTQVLVFIPLGKTCWWEGVKSGRFPKPVKLSARCTAWRVEDIRQLIEHLSADTSNG